MKQLRVDSLRDVRCSELLAWILHSALRILELKGVGSMKNITRMLAITIALLAIPAAIHAVSITLEEVRQYIKDNDLDWTAGETPISRLTDEEFQNLCGLQVPDGYVPKPEPNGLNPDPFERSSFDWRDHNGVTSVKNQGSCGSCWAFCTTAMMESFVLIYDGNNWDLSEQQLISCNNEGYGCGGGWIYPQHYVSPGGIFESCMPYAASDNPACIENQCEKVAFADDWAETGDTVTAIKNALVDGPVAVAMYARNNLSYYTGGCYSGGSSSSLNHGVLIVGYDDSECSGQGAWIVKNSWGASWGDNGFFKIKYGDSNIGYGATRIYYSPHGSVILAYASHVIDDSVYGNNNGVADPGETVTIRMNLGNAGNIPATEVGAILIPTNLLLTMNDNFATYPDIPVWGQSQSQAPYYSMTVNPSVPGGAVIVCNLSITSAEGSFNDSFNLQIGTNPAPTWTPGPPTSTPAATRTAHPTSTSMPGNPTNTPLPSFTAHATNTPIPTWTVRPTTTPTQPRTPTPTPVPNSTDTPSPTNPPVETWTPEPSPTPGGSGTETPRPTSTPEPESTYTPVPANTDIPTPTPSEEMVSIALELNKHLFRASDPFILTFKVNNNGASILSEQYVMLQIGAQFWFWPSWSDQLDRGLGIYGPGETAKDILAFQWPEVPGSAEGLTFHAVLCKPGSFDALSNIASVSFGYEE
jgi:hypothetical protein